MWVIKELQHLVQMKGAIAKSRKWIQIYCQTLLFLMRKKNMFRKNRVARRFLGIFFIQATTGHHCTLYTLPDTWYHIIGIETTSLDNKGVCEEDPHSQKEYSKLYKNNALYYKIPKFKPILNRIQPSTNLKTFEDTMYRLPYTSIGPGIFKQILLHMYCLHEMILIFPRPTPLSSLMTQYAFQEKLIYSK